MAARMIPYSLPPVPFDAALVQTAAFADRMRQRRSCRAFSPEPVSRELIVELVRTAHSAPSGANRQPWRFVAVDDPDIKHQIRLAAEAEERESYGRRMPREWLEALEPIGTDVHKPFLEIAPWLIVVFRIDWEEVEGRRYKSYYPSESVGIAVGLFLTACHLAGLATLTHTPSPMNFLRDILARPANEKPYLLIPVGRPAPDAVAPDLPRKPLEAVLQFNRG